MIKIVTGQKLIDISKSVIFEINDKKENLSSQNIIVVPDRFSLLAEKMVFDALNIKSSFNIRVMGITSLAKDIISKAGLNCVYLTNDECKFLLFRALQKCKENFSCFSKNLSQGLCQKIQNILSLIRSSDVNLNMLKLAGESASVSIQKKLQDLSMINDEYNELLNGRLDGTNTLKLFTSIIEQIESIKNTNFYFCGFDAFTKQGYEILRNIFKTANNVVVGCFYPNHNKNNMIFDKEMFNNITDILKEEKLEYIVQESHQVLSIPQKALFDNVYGFGIKSMQDFGYVNVLELATKQDEIKICANKIASLTKLKKCKYSDISIITTSDYFEDLKNVFDKYQISYYIDISKQFYSTEICNFIRFVLDLKNDNLSKESLLNLLNNSFVNIDKNLKEDIQNYIITNEIEYKKTDKLFENFDMQEFGEIIKSTQKFKDKDNIKNYIENVENIFKKYEIKSKIDNLCIIFAKNNDLFNQKLYSQVIDKIEKLNGELVDCIEDELSFNEFYELYISALKEIKISQVPLSLDSVFVGDASSSFFEKTKYYFILGANQDVLPKPTKDLALLSDNEIEELDNVVKISPTSKMINRRTKFKLFDLLSSAEEKLYVFYHLQSDDGKKILCSPFVNDILTICGDSIKITQNDIYEKFDLDEITKTMFSCPNVFEAIKNLNSENQDSGLIKKSLLKLGAKLEYQKQNKENISNGEMMLKADETKVSQIESYYRCPFEHFVKYGLKLQEPKTANIEAYEFGNFLHKFVDIYVRENKNCLKDLSQEEIENKVLCIIDKLLSLNDYKKIGEEENIVTLNMLKGETIRFAKFLTYEAKNSDFKPIETEYKFNDENVYVLHQDKKYKIIGVIDRIDKCDDYFRIIDYKTGSNSKQNSSLKNVYYGTKIQVYVYLYAVEKIKGLKPFGAFYLPIVQSYSDAKLENEDDYKLHGYFLDNTALVEKADKTFNLETKSSRFLQAKYSSKSDVDNKNFVYSKNLTKEELDNITKYSLDIVKQGIKEIVSGNIFVSPFENECQFCKYKSICGIDVLATGERKGVKVDKNTFGEVENKNGK